MQVTNDNTTDWKALYEQALITIANLEQLTREMAKAYDGVKEEYFITQICSDF
jgi:hypothetical protein